MERQRIFPVLFAVLLAAAVFLGVYFFVLYRDINYLPEEALEDLCLILAEDDILLDGSLVSLKKEMGTVYISSSADYGTEAAVQLGEDRVKYCFSTPEGEVILLEKGAFFEFKSDYYFRYLADGETEYTDGSLDEEDFLFMNPVHPDEAAEECGAAKAFLEKGSSGFDKQTPFRLATEVTRVWEKDGIYYVECIRTVDGETVKENRAVCAVSRGTVTEAVGKWCFLTLGESYLSQLTDIFNILFSVKKEINGIRESADMGTVRVKSVERCYTLYYLDGNGGLCFVPCWRIATDVCGDFVYNAVDGSLCTE